MAWYYVLNGASLGPVPETELRHLHQQNMVTADTPVWTDGMAEWLPFQRSTLATDGATLAGPPAVTHLCAECGKLFPEDEMLHYERSWICAACKPLFFQKIKEGVAPTGTLMYASVGYRFLAIMIDGFVMMAGIMIVLIPLFLIMAFTGGMGKSTGPNFGLMALIFLIELGVPAGYEIFFIGKYGATPGKMAMKIKVTTPDAGPISYGRSTGRYFAKMLNGFTFYIGFLMAIWDDEKRALHDRICTTRVIRTQPY
jgi:uncharacterized RDD family membrane protein YckC